MNKMFTTSALLLSSLLTGIAQSPVTVVGTKTMGMTETAKLSVQTEGATSVQWILPRGFKAKAGQGTPTLSLQSTFLAQDGLLKAARTFADGHTDTLAYEINVYREVERVKNYTINEGEEIELAGTKRTKADIYYEQTGEMDGRPLYTAHRLTVLPPDVIEYSQPMLQTVTDNSVWVTWKTRSSQPSTVSYGTSAANLDQKAEGTVEKLGADYFWHSVQITGLQPNTVYSYKVTIGGDGTTYRFRTAPQPGSKQKMRILLMGDHQIKSRSGYEWLMQAAKRNVEKLYGNVEENIQMIMNVGDQVDLGTTQQYEQIHTYKSKALSPWLPIMTAVGNHETYNDPGMKNYAAHYHYEGLAYKGIKSETENYYAYQVGRILFVVLSTEHTGDAQKAWVQRVANEAKNDETVDFVISVSHRPIQAEQYVGDISAWTRNTIVPILNQTGKHVLNYGGHHHLYHRGQLADAPVYHIINGAASWDQLWGMSSEQDFDDVQKTLDYWGYQIIEFTYDDAPTMKAECYAIGNKDIVRDNLLIDSFARKYNQPKPHKPTIGATDATITLPYTFKGSEYVTDGSSPLNTVQYQISSASDFSQIVFDKVSDVENMYGSTHAPLHIPLDLNENADIRNITIPQNRIKNGLHYIRMRYRDNNMEWSEWSDARSVTIEGSIDGDPAVALNMKRVGAGDKFTIDYNYAPVGTSAWVGVYRKGDTPGGPNSTAWAYTKGVSGSMSFRIFEPDEYYVVMFKDGGYTECSPRVKFYVGKDAKFTTDKKVYNEGDSVIVDYSNASALDGDWLGVYRMGHVPGNGTDVSDSWNYLTKGQVNGSMVLGTGKGNAYKLPKGYYFLSYFSRDNYFEPFARQYFSVGNEISSVVSYKNNYTPGEDVLIDYTDGPGTPKDWVGFYREGKAIGTDELDGFFYTYGATDGTITIPAGKLKAGDYFVALYINDSYDAVSNTIHLSIGRAPQLNAETNEEGIMVATFEDNKAWRDAIATVMVGDKEIPAANYKVEAGKITITDPSVTGKAVEMTIKAKDWQDCKLGLAVSTSINNSKYKTEIGYHAGSKSITIFASSSGQVKVHGANGQMLLDRKVTPGRQVMSLHNIPRQTIIVTWRGSNHETISRKIQL